MNSLFELLQIALGNREKLSRVLSAVEWQEMLEEIQRQTIVGVMLDGLERIPQEDKPARIVLLQWIGLAQMIEKKNQQLNYIAESITKIFNNGGLQSCILKGQGLARLYPNPLHRQCGDIDLWVEPRRNSSKKIGVQEKRKKILSWLKSNYYKYGGVVIHHVDAEIFTEAATEIHFIPMWLYCPWHNRRLQHFFQRQSERQFSHYNKECGFSYPTADFNSVYCLVHLFHHLLDEGVGLRQVIDYYYVLKEMENLSSVNKEIVFSTIRSIGLSKFASAMMWVLKEVCRMPEGWMICKADEKAGRFVLEEIMRSGIFGQYDERNRHQLKEGALSRNYRKWKRQWQFVRFYPSEVLCIPEWKLWHWCWRKYHHYI